VEEPPLRDALGVGSVRPLVVVRRASAFDPGFIDRDGLFEPIAPAFRRLGPPVDFPAVDGLGRVFEQEGPVRFVLAGAKRRRGASVDAAALYDARIALAAEVPTRSRCWHDFMNALVWGTFPLAKHALHRRQHRAIVERLAPGARGLPRRTPELDALALVDEGGVVVLADDVEQASSSLATRRPGALAELLAAGGARLVVFGHAIYESLALGARPAVVAALVAQRTESSATSEADRRLAEALDDPARFLSPRELVRVDLSEASAQRAAIRIAPSSRMSSPLM
jgi:hypothetical protein